LDNTTKIDVQAEKVAFNDSIVQSGTYNDMAKPSEPVTKMELPQTELIGEKANIPSIEMAPVAPPSNYNTDNRNNMNPVVPASRESKLLKMQTSSPEAATNKKTTNIEKQISQNILPSIQKIAQQVNDMGTSQGKKSSMTEERPTIAPVNLIFIERSSKASQPPAWS
jgi:hypothetical protein